MNLKSFVKRVKMPIVQNVPRPIRKGNFLFFRPKVLATMVRQPSRVQLTLAARAMAEAVGRAIKSLVSLNRWIISLPD